MPCAVPPGDLALDDVRVDHGAAVLDRDVSQQRDAAGRDVDLARARVRGVRPVRTGHRLVAAARLEARRHVGRERVGLEVRDLRDLRERHALCRRAAHTCPAGAELDVGGRGLQEVRGDGDDAVTKHRRGLGDRAGQHRAAAAAAGARAERRDGGVALNGGDVPDVDAQGIGGELHDRRLEAVAARPTRRRTRSPCPTVRCGSSRPRWRSCPTPGVVGST